MEADCPATQNFDHPFIELFYVKADVLSLFLEAGFDVAVEYHQYLFAHHLILSQGLRIVRLESVIQFQSHAFQQP